MGQTQVMQLQNFVFLTYISFIIAFTGLNVLGVLANQYVGSP